MGEVVQFKLRRVAYARDPKNCVCYKWFTNRETPGILHHISCRWRSERSLVEGLTPEEAYAKLGPPGAVTIPVPPDDTPDEAA